MRQGHQSYLIKQWMKALYLDKTSDVPRKDFACQRIQIVRLALEANFDMGFAQESSWLIVMSEGLSA